MGWLTGNGHHDDTRIPSWITESSYNFRGFEVELSSESSTVTVMLSESGHRLRVAGFRGRGWQWTYELPDGSDPSHDDCPGPGRPTRTVEGHGGWMDGLGYYVTAAMSPSLRARRRAVPLHRGDVCKNNQTQPGPSHESGAS
jgi:hypothetical protein